MFESLIPVVDSIIKTYGVYGIILVLAVFIFGMFAYFFRLRDHIRNESSIDSKHFSDVKEHIQDNLDGVEHGMLQRGLQIISEKESPDSDSDCTMQNCRFVVREKFQSDIRTIAEHKIKFKTTGWMRENGFHKFNESEKIDYTNRRVVSLEKSLLKAIQDRAILRFPILQDHVEKIIDREELAKFMKDCVDYAIIKHNHADEEIKQYRISHGFMPDLIMKLIVRLGGVK